MSGFVQICPPDLVRDRGAVLSGHAAGSASADRAGALGDLTPYGWKARWQKKVVEDHRASILERLALRAGL